GLGITALGTSVACVTTVNAVEQLAFLRTHSAIPGLPKLPKAQLAVLLLARLGTQLRLAVGIGDALFLGHFLDQFGPPREAFQNIGRNPRDLEIVALAIHSESKVLKPIGKPHAKC